MSAVHNPFLPYGLWRNPFGELTRDERGRLAVLDRDQFLPLCSKANQVLQFVGPCGSGKSSHLHGLRQMLPQTEYVYFPEDGPRPQLPQARPVLIDEAQRMGPKARRAMLTGGGPVILTSHLDLSILLQYAGFSVHSIDLSRTPTPAHLAEILNRRIWASRIDHLLPGNGGLGPASKPGRRDGQFPMPLIGNRYAEKLLARFGVDLRAVEGYLYLQFQDCVAKGKPWLPVI